MPCLLFKSFENSLLIVISEEIGFLSGTKYSTLRNTFFDLYPSDINKMDWTFQYEYECKDCMKKYNKDITLLSKSLDKKTGQKVMKRNKNFLGINKFNLLSNLSNQKIVALGGISKKNKKKLHLLKINEFAGISYFEQ